MTVNGKSKELDTIIMEGELLDPPTYNSANRQALEMATLERRISETLKAMPRYGTHGLLRLAGKHTVDDLTRAVDTYEAAQQ